MHPTVQICDFTSLMKRDKGAVRLTLSVLCHLKGSAGASPKIPEEDTVWRNGEGDCIIALNEAMLRFVR